ncbi:MAG: hypothetical protein ACREJT_17135, partial [Myxococcota bacterium]
MHLRDLLVECAEADKRWRELVVVRVDPLVELCAELGDVHALQFPIDQFPIQACTIERCDRCEKDVSISRERHSRLPFPNVGGEHDGRRDRRN